MTVKEFFDTEAKRLKSFGLDLIRIGREDYLVAPRRATFDMKVESLGGLNLVLHGTNLKLECHKGCYRLHDGNSVIFLNGEDVLSEAIAKFNDNKQGIAFSYV